MGQGRNLGIISLEVIIIIVDEITHREPLKIDENMDMGGITGNDNIYKERLSIIYLSSIYLSSKGH